MDLLPSEPQIVLRLGAAVLAGGLLGVERERAGKAAGLRTHMMVSLGAAAFTLIAFTVFDRVRAMSPGEPPPDPIRLIQGVIGGIGFLGAGAIIQARGSVHGLTTAGSLWLAGALGIAVGSGAWLIAGTTVVLAILVLWALGHFERRFVSPRSDGNHEPDRE